MRHAFPGVNFRFGFTEGAFLGVVVRGIEDAGRVSHDNGIGVARRWNKRSAFPGPGPRG